ncbi:SDR family NAD(P)-dependent oxidoreductase [Halotalea alkalilenta]|uniref:Gluconate 5-dehydrogenase n=1 Tax=Halotalea alkalilenta TaxID=376489 RepID=A0A172YD10_9GAMM|nr:SDR family NAD(P)-dependent oxidoreductase [Halotalea alkalilenta]ANF56885.1 gluconate 5-dehydrogenase [Halotalea alkalilenta]
MRDALPSLKLFDLTGKRALITGASQGIGFALAEGLGGAGATVIINGRDPRRLEAAADRLAELDIKVETAAFDVTDTHAVNRGISALEEEGPIDILINNAGIQRRAPLHEFTEIAWDELLLANLTSVFYVAKRVVRGMIERRAGKIINICSVQSELGRQTIAPYTATKGAVKMLTKGMCADWARYDIQVNGLAPGYFETELNKALVENEEFSAWLCNRTPTGRWGKVEELQGAAIFLAGPASSFVNGQIVYVDGGLTSTV